MNEHSSSEEYETDDDNPLSRVGEPHLTNCSSIDDDWIGVIRIQHRETGEQRLLIEVFETIGDDDDEELAGVVAETILDRAHGGKVMLTPSDARAFAATLLEFADTADGTSPLLLTSDWDKSFAEELGSSE